MNKKLKLLPLFVMLLAGLLTGIITFVMHYDGLRRTWILVGVLLGFYIIGLILQKIIERFERQIADEEAKKAEEEGKVVEKEEAVISDEEEGSVDPSERAMRALNAASAAFDDGGNGAI
ncbi:MAG: hypothetical protein K5662_06410 [Lachnospiraceae bacterium]|nr:hypothetical protein [Lachnospiraceae bacterium]